MKEYQEKRKLRKFFFSGFFLTVLFCFLVFLSIATVKMYLKSREAVAKNDRTVEGLREIENRKNKLEQELKLLQMESGMDEEIRKNLEVAKPGEKVLVIMDEKKVDVGNISKEEENFWQKIKNVFK